MGASTLRPLVTDRLSTQLPLVTERLGDTSAVMGRCVASASQSAHAAWSNAPGSSKHIETRPTPPSTYANIDTKKRPYRHPAALPGDWRQDASCDYVGWTTAESWADAARIGGKI